MSGWAGLTDFLVARGDVGITLSFEQIEDLTGSALPASARNHRPFWSNSDQNPYSRHWVAWGFKTTTRGVATGFMRFERVGIGTAVRTGAHVGTVTPAPPVDPRTRQPAHFPREHIAREGSIPDLILLGCVKKKRSTAQRAKDLYCSPLWAKRRAYAEASGHRWLILSAQHGLVGPDDVLDPYDLSLAMIGRDAQRRWAAGVDEELAIALGSVESPVVEFHAGMDYQRFLRPLLEVRGITVRYPLEGLTQGAQLGWYKSDIRGSQHRQESTGGTGGQVRSVAHGVQSVSTGLLRATSGQLLDPAQRVRPKDFRSLERSRLNSAGLYSWWADELAREMLGDVLRTDIRELIYVGQTGATRWPSGKRSSGTLWTRIATQHLSGRIDTSTFRLTLAAALSEPLGFRVGGGRLDPSSGESLSRFIANHLSVAPVPVTDPDSLGELEGRIVQMLDPPLNLQHVDRSDPSRRRLSKLRRSIVGLV